MLTKRIIPCLDVKDGRVVKGVHFTQLIDAGNPVEIARLYNRMGADELVFLDITATLEERDTICQVVEEVANQVFIPLTVGGGIRSVEDMKRILRAGADKIALNSAAVQDPNLITRGAQMFGSQCIVLAIDGKKRQDGSGWNVFTHGGSKDSGIDLLDWVREVEALGAGEILLTSIDADGTKQGFAIEMTRAVTEIASIPVIASGGAGGVDDFVQILTLGGADAALAASLFHFGQLSVAQVKDALKAQGVSVRASNLPSWASTAGNKELNKKVEASCGLANLKFDPETGLVPAIVQDAKTKEILMLAYMNQESLALSLATGESWFYSRSRQKLWYKGGTSGNTQRITEISYDCDGDTLLLKVVPAGPACHTGETSCFYRMLYTAEVFGCVDNTTQPLEVVERLFNRILDRKVNPIDGSYTNYLFNKGLDKILKKVGEETAEVIIGAKNSSKDELIYEVADLTYHLLVLLAELKTTPQEIAAELIRRFA